MPKRIYKKIRRVDSETVQGEGSYVELKSFTWKELKELGFDSIDLEANTMEAADLAFDVAKESLVGWNWVDDDGKPLPDPAENGVFENLPSQEQTFIIKNMNIAVDEKKVKN